MTQAVLWTVSEIVAVTKGSHTGENRPVTGVSIDTRDIKPGDLFIALKGPNFDGNQFAEEALEKGATAVLTTRKGNPGFITVPDTFTALHDLGAGGRARSNAKIIAVTGSVGKTSVKAMLQATFAMLGKTHASDASLNNHWGVPLSLARMPMDAEYAIFEIGMNHANEIAPLSKLVSPHVSIITTIASAHIQNLGSMENIARAKAEIFQGMSPDGTAILPHDSELYPILLAEARTQGLQKIISFGQSEKSDIRLVGVHGDQHDMIDATINNQPFSFKFGIPGSHQMVNALSVIAAVKTLDGDIRNALHAFATMTPVSGRGDQVPVHLPGGGEPLLVINETHNASPIAVKAALVVLQNTPVKNRRIIALGDMLELGPDSPQFHAELKDAILQTNPHAVYLSGPLMKHLADVLPPEITHHFASSDQLAVALCAAVQPGDAVLLKGSRGAKMKLVVDALVELGQSVNTSTPPLSPAIQTG